MLWADGQRNPADALSAGRRGRITVGPVLFAPGNQNTAEDASRNTDQLLYQKIFRITGRQRTIESESHQSACRKMKQPVHDNSIQTEGEAFRFERLTAKA